MAPERLMLWIIAVSLASLFFILPHVVEDFAAGIAQGIGLSTEVGAFFLGGFLALQSLGLVLVGQGRRVGLIVTFWVGLAWVAGALVDHGPALLAGGFRAGPTSVLWVVGLMVTQAASSFLAWWGSWGQKSRRPLN
jgi:hypothetical protein